MNFCICTICSTRLIIEGFEKERRREYFIYQSTNQRTCLPFSLQFNLNCLPLQPYDKALSVKDFDDESLHEIQICERSLNQTYSYIEISLAISCNCAAGVVQSAVVNIVAVM